LDRGLERQTLYILIRVKDSLNPGFSARCRKKLPTQRSLPLVL
jgi:hypothetical protein